MTKCKLISCRLHNGFLLSYRLLFDCLSICFCYMLICLWMSFLLKLPSSHYSNLRVHIHLVLLVSSLGLFQPVAGGFLSLIRAGRNESSLSLLRWGLSSPSLSRNCLMNLRMHSSQKADTAHRNSTFDSSTWASVAWISNLSFPSSRSGEQAALAFDVDSQKVRG